MIKKLSSLGQGADKSVKFDDIRTMSPSLEEDYGAFGSGKKYRRPKAKSEMNLLHKDAYVKKDFINDENDKNLVNKALSFSHVRSDSNTVDPKDDEDDDDDEGENDEIDVHSYEESVDFVDNPVAKYVQLREKITSTPIFASSPKAFAKRVETKLLSDDNTSIAGFGSHKVPMAPQRGKNSKGKGGGAKGRRIVVELSTKRNAFGEFFENQQKHLEPQPPTNSKSHQPPQPQQQPPSPMVRQLQTLGALREDTFNKRNNKSSAQSLSFFPNPRGKRNVSLSNASYSTLDSATTFPTMTTNPSSDSDPSAFIFQGSDKVHMQNIPISGTEQSPSVDSMSTTSSSCTPRDSYSSPSPQENFHEVIFNADSESIAHIVYEGKIDHSKRGQRKGDRDLHAKSSSFLSNFSLDHTLPSTNSSNYALPALQEVSPLEVPFEEERKVERNKRRGHRMDSMAMPVYSQHNLQHNYYHNTAIPPDRDPESESSYLRDSFESQKEHSGAVEVLLLFSKVRHNHIEEVKRLLNDKSFSIVAMDSNGNTMLHICAQNNLRKMAVMLVTDYNIPVNVENLNGVTALDLSVKFCFDRMTKTLLSFGAEAGEGGF